MKVESGVAIALLALWVQSGPANAQFAEEGERLFLQLCAACHMVEPGQYRVGPHLGGLIGREAGSVEGARYSAAMTELGIRWDEVLLDDFLSNPQQVVPGTSMPVSVPDSDQRLAIVDYLKSLSN